MEQDVEMARASPQKLPVAAKLTALPANYPYTNKLVPVKNTVKIAEHRNDAMLEILAR